MSRRYALIPLLVALVAAGSRLIGAGPAQTGSGLVAHEWGTFTTVAAWDGSAQQWLPLGGPTDLPCFVEHFQDSGLYKVLPAGYGALLNYDTARTKLNGTVRMETPVLYFYADRPTRVDVTAKFQSGLFTEWYPHATVLQPGPFQNIVSRPGLSNAQITWTGVRVQPGATSNAFPQGTGKGKSHYYTARDAGATPLQVGDQHEGFLFYRGVGGFDAPVTARLVSDHELRLENHASAPIHHAIVFRNVAGKIGYRVVGDLTSPVTVDLPEAGGTLAALRDDLRHALVADGLYEKEAAAMVATWHDTWFEEGTRVFYVMPTMAVDGVLPLTITPAPASISRVFVGRMDVIDRSTIDAVKFAFAEDDQALLDRFGRFLSPIADRILAETASPAARADIEAALDATLKRYAARLSRCE